MFHLSGSDNKKNANVEQTQLSKIIIDSIDDGVFLIDPDRLIQLINPSAAKLSGWKVEDAMGISSDSVFLLTDSKQNLISEANNPLHIVFTEGQSINTTQFFMLSRDKRSFPISLHITPITGKNNRVIKAIAVFNDISEEKTTEQQRADFISTASHEMRTPVAAIEGYLSLALNDRVATIDNKAREYLEKAHISTQHLGKLFQDLLTSAKAEDGRLTSHPQVLNMTDYLTQLSNDLSIVAQKKGLAMDYVAGSSGEAINASKGVKVIQPIYYVFADPDRLREVISNLFDNAIKYTSEGKVTIGLTGNNQVVQCFIKDTGPGIPADDLPHLFQKFYRVDNTTTRTVGGTGLGLFICRKIIELYNGKIWAESEIGKGSTFYINLPRLTNVQAKKLSTTEQTGAYKPINNLASA